MIAIANRFRYLLRHNFLFKQTPKVSFMHPNASRLFASNPINTSQDKGDLAAQWISRPGQKDLSHESHPLEIYCGNLPFEATDQDIKDFFKECGNPEILKTSLDRFGNKKPFVFIKFSSENEVNKALKLNGALFFGRTLRINKADDASKIEESRRKIINGRNASNIAEIVIKNLPTEASSDEIKAIFKNIGDIIRFKLVTHKNCAYVEFSSKEALYEALQFNDYLFKGKNISVNIAPARKFTP
ncbi:unnamed protein product [Blepharisma stoltei]|uniref:RRM domain-containing protein n=1 Tax=Blepharisma stoltei TaxID=1481888 RepID=A0AAU9J3U6_9CILI|nr:unnamed protein product [Blepharisma stoltei]